MSTKAISSVVLATLVSLSSQEARAACAGQVPQSEVVSSDNILWVEAPNLSQSLVPRSPAKTPPLAALLVPKSIRDSILKITPTALLYATYRGATGKPQESTLFVETACQANGQKTAAEWVTLLNDATLVPVALPGRVGFATQTRVDQANARAVSPLATSPDYQALAKTPADARGRLNLQSLFGWMARQKNGRETAGVVERLGLLSAQALTFWSLGNELSWELTVQDAQKGLLAAAGPEIPQTKPAFVPDNAIAFVRASVSPGTLMNVIHLVTAYQWPMQSAVARANLDAAETRVGKRWVDDILGHAPRTLTFYQAPSKSGVATVVAIEMADAKSGELFVAALGELLPAISPGARVLESKVSGARVLTFSPGKRDGLAELHIAFRDQTMTVATDLTTLKTHLGKTGTAKPFAEGSAVAYGFAKDGSWLTHVGAPADLAKALSHTQWRVTRASTGFSGKLEAKGK